MARKRRAVPREISPDYKFGSILVQKLINCIMWKGKMEVAREVVYQAMEEAANALGVKPLEALEKVIKNLRPVLEVKARRVGGATYQVPIEIRPRRAQQLAIRWLIYFARQRKGRPMWKKLTEEIIAAAKGEGLAIKKKEDTHKMAEANRAFAHYRW